MTEERNIKEYKHGDTVHLTVELQDDNGVEAATTTAMLEGEDFTQPNNLPVGTSITLDGWIDEPKQQAEIVLTGKVHLNDPGLYLCYAILTENAQGGFKRTELEPPLQFCIVEPPDYVWQGPEVLSVGEFW